MRYCDGWGQVAVMWWWVGLFFCLRQLGLEHARSDVYTPSCGSASTSEPVRAPRKGSIVVTPPPAFIIPTLC